MLYNNALITANPQQPSKTITKMFSCRTEALQKLIELSEHHIEHVTDSFDVVVVQMLNHMSSVRTYNLESENVTGDISVIPAWHDVELEEGIEVIGAKFVMKRSGVADKSTWTYYVDRIEGMDLEVFAAYSKAVMDFQLTADDICIYAQAPVWVTAPNNILGLSPMLPRWIQ